MPTSAYLIASGLLGATDFASWDRLGHPIWIFDPDTCRGLYANPPAIALWDADSAEELLARDFSNLSPTVRTRTESLARATAGGATVSESWTFYPKGRPFTVQAEISAYPLTDGRSALLFEASPIAVDANERRAVEALRYTSSLISLFSADGDLVFSNPAAIAAYGEGAAFTARFQDPQVGARLLAAVQGGAVVAELAGVRTKTGARSHHIDARQTPDPVTGAPAILLSERDVTTQVEAERALLAAEERAAAAVAKERLLSNISHELRTPLTSILGYADLLARDDRLPADARERVSTVRASGETLLKLVNDAIALSELDQGQMLTTRAPFDLEDLLNEVAAGVERTASLKGLDLQVELDPDLPRRLIGDRGKIIGVLERFAANAVKFTAKGEVRIGARLDPPDARVRFYVSDTGPGLSPEDAAKAFERFSQVDDSRRRVEGAGLGLAVATNLAAVMGAKIGTEPAHAGGAIFHLDIALEAAADEDEDREAASAADARPLNILYADDHENNRRLVTAILESQGHACDVAVDGQAALDAAFAYPYDLVLLDIQMPIMDGVAAARALRDDPAYRTKPILALTANTQEAELRTYAAAGLDDCIAKPVRVPDLIAKVEAWAARGAARGQEVLAAQA